MKYKFWCYKANDMAYLSNNFEDPKELFNGFSFQLMKLNKLDDMKRWFKKTTEN